MQSQFAYAAAADLFGGSAAIEPAVLDEVRVQGRIGGGDRADSMLAGIKGLMLAVLEDAIQCFLSTNRMERDEAEAWMTMRMQNWTFSFVNVCATLGLEPSAVRKALRVMREGNTKQSGRVRAAAPTSAARAASV